MGRVGSPFCGYAPPVAQSFVVRFEPSTPQGASIASSEADCGESLGEREAETDHQQQRAQGLEVLLHAEEPARLLVRCVVGVCVALECPRRGSHRPTASRATTCGGCCESPLLPPEGQHSRAAREEEVVVDPDDREEEQHQRHPEGQLELEAARCGDRRRLAAGGQAGSGVRARGQQCGEPLRDTEHSQARRMRGFRDRRPVREPRSLKRRMKTPSRLWLLKAACERPKLSQMTRSAYLLNELPAEDEPREPHAPPTTSERRAAQRRDGAAGRSSGYQEHGGILIRQMNPSSAVPRIVRRPAAEQVIDERKESAPSSESSAPGRGSAAASAQRRDG